MCFTCFDTFNQYANRRLDRQAKPAKNSRFVRGGQNSAVMAILVTIQAIYQNTLPLSNPITYLYINRIRALRYNLAGQEPHSGLSARSGLIYDQ